MIAKRGRLINAFKQETVLTEMHADIDASYEEKTQLEISYFLNETIMPYITSLIF